MKRNVVLLLLCPSFAVPAQTDGIDRTVRPPAAPLTIQRLLGEYHGAGDTVRVLEEAGALFLRDRRQNEVLMRTDADGSYAAEQKNVGSPQKVTFLGPSDRRPDAMTIGARRYTRRVFDGEDGNTFTITPLLSVPELRRRANAARPPVERGAFRETDLVELRSLDSTIRYDIRYATTNNFMKQRFDSRAEAYLQRPAAERFARAHQWLAQFGYGLLVHDAYRPWRVTKMFWDATPQKMKGFVANPKDGSRHNRGCAVDVTLYDRTTGAPVDMVSGYDEFSERAYPQYRGGTSLQRWHRALLRDALEREGFKVYPFEWWHFDFQDWKSYRIGVADFEELAH